MKRVIDIDTWKRKEHFHFFNGFDDPFWGTTVNVDFTFIYNKAKEEGHTFFLSSLHEIMRAVNAVEELKYRIEEDNVVCYDTIHVSPTIAREDGTFSFSFFNYDAEKDVFIQNAMMAIDKVQKSSGLGLNEDSARIDTIHFSSVPWFQFTDMKHATSFGRRDSVPKISVGKYFRDGARIMMPLSITVNHALVDGLHVARFVNELENAYK